MDEADSELVEDLVLAEDFHHLLLDDVLRGALEEGVEGIVKVREGLVLSGAVGVDEGGGHCFSGRYVLARVGEL